MAGCISDIDGILVGHAVDEGVRTGVSVILPDKTRLRAAVDVRGGGPGTRESDLLRSENLVEEIDALFLSGGSSYGLAAGSALADWLGAQGRGFGALAGDGVPLSPIVPGAILYDLANGGDKNWGEKPPYAALALAAAKNARAGGGGAAGNIGAGYGALAGRLKGGLASALAEFEGYKVGALVAVNSFGSAVMPGSPRLWAGFVEEDDEMGGQAALPLPQGAVLPDPLALSKADTLPGQNTTLAVVATDANLSRPQLQRLAMMAQTGLTQAIRPAHTPFDGDIVFALSTMARGGSTDMAGAFLVTRLGALAARVLSRAIGRAVFMAEDLGGAASYRRACFSGALSGK